MYYNRSISYSQTLEKIVTPSALIIIDGDVVKTYTNADTEFSDDSAEENLEAIWDLVKNKYVYHLVVPDPTTHITVEARKHRSSNFDSRKRAEAIVIKTLGHRILAQVYMKMRSEQFPVKIFDCEHKAIEWFDTLRSAAN